MTPRNGNASAALISGVAFQSLRELHEPECELCQHVLIVGIADALRNYADPHVIVMDQ